MEREKSDDRRHEICVLCDALHLLEEYRQYADEMRKVGRGFEPVGLAGHSAESVRTSLLAMALRH